MSGWGTGGTISGVGSMLRVARPEVKIVATEPEGAQLLAGKPFTPHKIQGTLQSLLPRSSIMLLSRRRLFLHHVADSI